MKILYAIQGTGNGHLSRARDIYPALQKFGEVDVLISGCQVDVAFPFPVTYRCHGLSFVFGKHGGVSIGGTLAKLKLHQLLKEIYMVPVEEYDLVVNDFEPVTAWACKLRGIPNVGLSHQSAVLHPDAPKPAKKDLLGMAVLRHYAPVAKSYGFHFQSYGKGVYTPVIRDEVRRLSPTDKGHYTVYLPAYDDASLVRHLSQFNDVHWQVFSKHNKRPFTKGNVSVHGIDNDAFLESMAASTGVLCGAGFEGPSEALFLGKKLLVIPMKGQYEQQCNAAALQTMGVPVISELHRRNYETIRDWIIASERPAVSYPDQTSDIIAKLLFENLHSRDALQPSYT